MSDIQVLLTIMLSGFGLNFALMLIIWNSLNARIDASEKKIEDKFARLEDKFDKLDEKVTDIDRRLCRIEGALSAKDCCMLKEDKQLKRAE